MNDADKTEAGNEVATVADHLEGYATDIPVSDRIFSGEQLSFHGLSVAPRNLVPEQIGRARGRLGVAFDHLAFVCEQYDGRQLAEACELRARSWYGESAQAAVVLADLAEIVGEINGLWLPSVPHRSPPAA